jgi:hypothetical protein
LIASSNAAENLHQPRQRACAGSSPTALSQLTNGIDSSRSDIRIPGLEPFNDVRNGALNRIIEGR